MRLLISFLLSLAFVLFSTSCLATSQDFDRVSERVQEVERVVEDESATEQDLQDALSSLRQELEAGAQRVVERGEQLSGDFVEGLTGGGVMGALSGVVMHFMRQGQRRRRGEPTTPAEAAAQRRELEERLMTRLRDERNTGTA